MDAPRNAGRSTSVSDDLWQLCFVEADFKTQPKNPVSFKLVLDGQDSHKSPLFTKDMNFRWEPDSLFVPSSSDWTIIVREVFTLHKREICAIDVKSEVSLRENQELSVSDRGGKVKLKLGFSNPKKLKDIANMRVEQAGEAVEKNKHVLLEHLVSARVFIEAIMRMGAVAAEIHPAAGVAIAALSVTLDKMQKMKECHEAIANLVSDMTTMLSFVDEASQDAFRLEPTRHIILKMLKAVEKTSAFVSDYATHGTLRSFIMSSASQVKINTLKQDFSMLKDNYDRIMQLEIRKTIINAEENVLLDRLQPVGGAYYDPEQVCLEGTRQKLLQDILLWANESAEQRGLYWLNGLAGSGKSTIAHSVAHMLQGRNQLGACFFFRRDDPDLRKADNVIPTLVASLARLFKPYAKAVALALQTEPTLPSQAIQLQFNGLIVKPLQSITKPSSMNFILVVDALNECAVPKERLQILSCLCRLSLLTNWVKVFVTSRPSSEIKQEMITASSLHIQTSLTDVEAHSDIVHYTRTCMKDIADINALDPDWPGEHQIQRLAERSCGLFLWISTMAQFVKEALDVEDHLDIVLSGQSAGDAESELDNLYSTVLNQTSNTAKEVVIVQTILGAIVATAKHKPLPISALRNILPSSVSQKALEKVIDRLHAVLYIDRKSDGAVRICHPSFVDFMSVESRCPSQYWANPDIVNAGIALRSLAYMKDRLQFNICQLDSSYALNKHVDDLQQRISKNVSHFLQYSCLYWVDHLSEASPGTLEKQDTLDFIKAVVCKQRAFYWIEVLSLMQEMHSAISILYKLQGLVKSYPELTVAARDIFRFVSAFSEPISQSTPHLYVSALAWVPKETFLAKEILPGFPNRVTFGGEENNTWPGCLRTTVAHGPIMSVDYSPDGQHIVTGSMDKVICIWDSMTGAPVSEPFVGHSDGVRSVRYSPDGKQLVSASQDNTICIWNAKTGAPISQPFTGHKDSVLSVEFSPDGQHIVSGSADCSIIIWNARNGKAMITIREHSSGVRGVAYMSDGQAIVSGSQDKTIRVWDATTGKAIMKPITGHTHEVWTVACSHDGSLIVSGSKDCTVRIWDAKSGAAIRKPFIGHTHEVWCVRFSPNDQNIVSSSRDNIIHIWDVRTGNSQSGPLTGHTNGVRAVAYSPDGQYVASGSQDNNIRIWDANVSKTTSGPLDQQSLYRAWSSSSDSPISPDQKDDVSLAVRNGHSAAVAAVSFCPFGDHILSGSWDNTVCIWDAVTGKAISKSAMFTGHTQEVWTVAYSPDKKRIASGSRDCTVRLWHTESGLPSCEPLTGHTGGVRCVAFSPNGLYIASGADDHKICVWDTKTAQMIYEPINGHTHEVWAVAFSPDGLKIASGSRDCTVRLWDAKSGSPLSSPFSGHTNSICSVMFSPDGTTVVTSSEDNTIRVWDTQTGKEIFSPLSGHSGGVRSAVYSPDGRHIASGSQDNTIRVWDAMTGNVISEPLTGHTSGIRSVAYSPDGKLIVSGSRDKSVRLWLADISAQIISDQHHGAAHSVVFGSKAEGDETNSMSLDILITPFSQRTIPLEKLGKSVRRINLPLESDGWWKGPDGELLLWIAPEYRHHFCDFSVLTIGQHQASSSFFVDFSRFVHGSDWISVMA